MCFLLLATIQDRHAWKPPCPVTSLSPLQLRHQRQLADPSQRVGLRHHLSPAAPPPAQLQLPFLLGRSRQRTSAPTSVKVPPHDHRNLLSTSERGCSAHWGPAEAVCCSSRSGGSGGWRLRPQSPRPDQPTTSGQQPWGRGLPSYHAITALDWQPHPWTRPDRCRSGLLFYPSARQAVRLREQQQQQQ